MESKVCTIGWAVIGDGNRSGLRGQNMDQRLKGKDERFKQSHFHFNKKKLPARLYLPWENYSDHW